jgi:hypothetical protein
VAGRFSKRHMRCIREEDKKSNKQVMDKLLVQMSLFSVILVNAIIFSDISLLREDPLSMSILDMFFRKYPIIRLLAKREFIYLKLPKFSTASTRMIHIEAGSLIPYLGFHSELSSYLKRMISEPGCNQQKGSKAIFLLLPR